MKVIVKVTIVIVSEVNRRLAVKNRLVSEQRLTLRRSL